MRSFAAQPVRVVWTEQESDVNGGCLGIGSDSLSAITAVLLLSAVGDVLARNCRESREPLWVSAWPSAYVPE
jgi:hypothetical protein